MLPSLFSGAQAAVLVVFLPIPVVACFALSLESRLAAFEASAVRAVPLRDAALVVMTLLACLCAALAVQSDTAMCVTRNAAFLTGLMLLTRPLARQAAVMVPVIWIALVVFLSRRPWPDPDPWTVLPEPASAPNAILAAAVALAAGLVLHLCARPEQS
ncbi:hypothetical protein ACIHFB_23065 [Streptomyces sp. NPDC051963]|uniref:hypothetical protein n=1 Tax=Streptomyces sp. NPDC051963 TaxID=3365678 RepID=UPI0037D82061